jgi:hypothetical protein
VTCVPAQTLSSATIVGLLAAPARLRVVAALVLGAQTPAEVARLAALDEDQVSVAVNRLIRAGLVKVQTGRFLLDTQAIATAARVDAPQRPEQSFGTADPATIRVLRAFIVDGALSSIPVPGRKRRVVLEYLAAGFEPGVRYTEAQVNAVLRAWHDDVAALRRYLVEEGLLSREHGQYWRSGGWVDVL